MAWAWASSGLQNRAAARRRVGPADRAGRPHSRASASASRCASCGRSAACKDGRRFLKAVLAPVGFALKRRQRNAASRVECLRSEERGSSHFARLDRVIVLEGGCWASCNRGMTATTHGSEYSGERRIGYGSVIASSPKNAGNPVYKIYIADWCNPG